MPLYSESRYLYRLDQFYSVYSEFALLIAEIVAILMSDKKNKNKGRPALGQK